MKGGRSAIAQRVIGFAMIALALGVAVAIPAARFASWVDALEHGAHRWIERARRVPTPVWRAPTRASLARGGGAIATLPGRFQVESRFPLESASPVVALARVPGAIIAGTFDEGLFRLNEGEARFIHRPLPVDPRINDLAADDAGNLFVATNGGAYEIEPTSRITRFAPGAFTAVAVWRGHVYFASRRGLSVVEGQGLWTRGADQGVEADAPDSLADCGDALCIGASDGLWRFDGTRAERASSAAGELPTDWVTAAAFGGGALWAGTFDGGLARRDGAGWRRFAPSDGLSDGRVQPHALVALSEGGAIAATPTGLIVLRREGVAVAPRTPGIPSQPTALARAGDDIWVGGAGAVARLRFEEGRP